VSRTEHVVRTDGGLIRALREAESPDEIRFAASEIYRSFLDTGRVNRAGLRKLLETTDSDEKQACILQLLGEVRDDDAFDSFVSVLEEYRNALDDSFRQRLWIPTKRVTAAVTFLRLIKIPDGALEKTARLVTKCVRCFDSPPECIEEYKQFNLGGLVTLGIISRLHWSYRVFREALTYSADYDVKREAIEGIRQLVETDLREGRRSFAPVTIELTRLLDGEQNRIRNSSAIEVTPSERLVSGALLALVRVNADTACSRLMELIMTARLKGNDYLRGTFAQVLRALPEEQREMFFSEVDRQVPKAEVASFLSYIFAS